MSPRVSSLSMHGTFTAWTEDRRFYRSLDGREPTFSSSLLPLMRTTFGLKFAQITFSYSSNLIRANLHFFYPHQSKHRRRLSWEKRTKCDFDWTLASFSLFICRTEFLSLFFLFSTLSVNDRWSKWRNQKIQIDLNYLNSSSNLKLIHRKFNSWANRSSPQSSPDFHRYWHYRKPVIFLHLLC